MVECGAVRKSLRFAWSDTQSGNPRGCSEICEGEGLGCAAGGISAVTPFLHAPQAYTAPTIAECQCQVPTLALSGPQRHTAAHTPALPSAQVPWGGGSGGLTFHPRCSCRTPRRGRTSRRNLSCPTYWHRTALWRHPGKEGGQGGEAEGSQGPARAVRVGSIFLCFCFSGQGFSV